MKVPPLNRHLPDRIDETQTSQETSERAEWWTYRRRRSTAVNRAEPCGDERVHAAMAAGPKTPATTRSTPQSKLTVGNRFVRHRATSPRCLAPPYSLLDRLRPQPGRV